MQNNLNGSSITIYENAEDIKRSSAILTEYSQNMKGWRKNCLKITNVIMIITIIITIAITILGIMTDSLLAVFIYAIIAVVSIVSYVWYKKIVKKGLAGQLEKLKKARITEYADGFHTVSYSFGEDSVYVENKYRSSSFSYKNIFLAVEFAEGIFIAQNPVNGRTIWLPARFFSKASAEKITALLKENLGKKYTVKDKLCAPESADAICPDSKIEPAGKKLMTLVNKPSKGKKIKDSVVNVLVRSKRNIFFLLILLAAFLSAGFFRQIVSTAKLISKIVGLVRNYIETGIVGGNSEIASTVMSLLITAVGFIVMIIIIILIVIYSANLIQSIINAVKANKELKPVTDNEQIVDIYDDVIVLTSALGKYTTEWSSVTKAVRKNGQVQIHDRRLRYMLVSLADNEEQKQQLFDLLTARLGKNWHKPQAVVTASANAVYKADTYGTKTE